MMNTIRTWGWLIGVVLTLVCVSVYAFSIRALTTHATNIFSPANSRNETALIMDTKVYALARTTREQREAIRSAFVGKSTLVHVFDDIEQIRKRTGTSIKVLGITESAPQTKKRSRRSADEEGTTPSGGSEVSSLPQPKGLASVSVSLELRGSQDSLIQTIKLLEQLPVLSNAESVSLRTRDAGTNASSEWVSNVVVFLPTLTERGGSKE